MGALGILVLPEVCLATQLHHASEGIIVHQAGHIFFLFSMVVLIFTISGRHLSGVRGWRLIQYAALFFILWNLDALAAHFLDNQIAVVKIRNVSVWQMTLENHTDSRLLSIVYYILKLDHLLCVPAMVFLYTGLSRLHRDQKSGEGES